MKIKHQTFIGCTVLFATCTFAQVNGFLITNTTPYPAQLTVKVLADDSAPVGCIGVRVRTFSRHIPGDNFGTDEYKEANGLTDTNGVATLAFKCITGEVDCGTRPFVGFYGNVNSKIRFTNVVSGQWQPWNPTGEIHIKRILNPIPMYARRIKESKVPVEGMPVGFDLMVGDWVAPYGKGQTPDFVFKLERKTEPAVRFSETPPFDVTLTVSFSDDGDGIQSIFVTPQNQSELQLPRRAPLDGYQPVLVKHQYKERGQKVHSNFLPGQNYFFRVRTKKDSHGKIVSALYGKTNGDFRGGLAGKITFTYYLNPETNSLNMEFDPAQNRFKKLPILEQVNLP